MFDEQLKALEDMSKELDKKKIVKIEPEKVNLSKEERQKIVKRLLDSHVLTKLELRELADHLGGEFATENYFDSFEEYKQCEFNHHCPKCGTCSESDYPGFLVTEIEPTDEERLQRPSLTQEQLDNDDRYVYQMDECEICGYKKKYWWLDTTHLFY